MTKKQTSKRRKHIPLRTCIACRTSRPKRQLVRIVHTSDGTIQVDETGKKNGRGAYLCRCQTCWKQALQRGILNHALRSTLSPEDHAILQAYADTLPETLEESVTD